MVSQTGFDQWEETQNKSISERTDSSLLVSLFNCQSNSGRGFNTWVHSFMFRSETSPCWTSHLSFTAERLFKIRAFFFLNQLSALSSAGVYLCAGGRGPGWFQPPRAQWCLHWRQLLPGNWRSSDRPSPPAVFYLHLWTVPARTFLHRQPPAGKQHKLQGREVKLLLSNQVTYTAG